MKTVFLIDNLKFSGGRKTFLEFAVHLRKKGHEVQLLTLNPKGDLANVMPDFKVLPVFSPANIPACDFIVTTTPDEVKSATNSAKGKVIHFCQGFEVEDLENRISGKITPARYQGTGFFSKLTLARKKLEWRHRVAELDRIYSLNTILVAISPHLKEVIEKRYGRKVHFCRYGVKKDFFYPGKDSKPKSFTAETPCRIISIGPVGVTFKGIPDTLESVRIIKEENRPIKFIRVSPDEKKGEDMQSGIIDEYHHGLNPAQLGDLLRSCDIYISNSLEGEGFGLPAMEAMSCGLLCILSSISSYVNFDPLGNYALFVPERNTQATADAIRKLLSSTDEEKCKLRDRALKVAGNYSFEDTMNHLEEILKSEI